MLSQCLRPAAAAVGPSTQPSPEHDIDMRALLDEVQALRAEVKELREKARLQPSATTPSTVSVSAEAAARDMIDDADRHTRLLDSTGMSAGWTRDRGFFLQSDDNNFLMSPFVLLQVRGVANVRQDAKPDHSDDTQTGFEIRRLQFGLAGHAFSPDLTYRIFWQSSDLTAGNLSLLMAWVQYRIHGTPWVIGGGQFKAPFDHEQLISDARQLANDRTFVDDTLAGGEAFSRGVTLRYDDQGPLRAEAALTSGFNVPNTTFQSFPTNPADYGVAARGEYKLFGDWRDYEQFSSQQNHEHVLLVIGAGADYTEAGPAAFLRHTVDVQYNVGSLGLYAAYLGRYTRGNTAGRGGDTYDPSVRAQASLLLTPRWEVFGRYDYVHFDGQEFKTPTHSTVQEITGGINYYFFGQNLKFTLDLSYLPDGTPIPDPGNDILVSAHGELVVRGQFQLLL